MPLVLFITTNFQSKVQPDLSAFDGLLLCLELMTTTGSLKLAFWVLAIYFQIPGSDVSIQAEAETHRLGRLELIDDLEGNGPF